MAFAISLLCQQYVTKSVLVTARPGIYGYAERGYMKKIDTQSHIVTPRYLEEFLKVDKSYTAEHTPEGFMLNMRGSRVMLFVPPLVDVEARIKEMDEKQPETIEVLSLSTPQVYMEDKQTCEYLTRISNDEFAELQKYRPDKFMTFASLPMPHVNAAIDEMYRAMHDLKMNGFVLGTSVLGKYLDEDEFAPVFEHMDKLNGCLFLHPQPNIGLEHVKKYGLMPINGFIFDTTCCVSRLIFSGFFEKYPNIKLILPHLGGAIPYLAGRLDIGYHAYKEARANISKKPSEYLRNAYYDLVSYEPNALKFAAKLIGTDRMLYATDYPYVIGVPELIDKAFEEADFSQAEREQICYKNALSILNNVSANEPTSEI